MHLLHALLQKCKSKQQRQRQPASDSCYKNALFVCSFQLVCASEKGNFESPMGASCVSAEEVETWVAAKLITTTTMMMTTTTTEETTTTAARCHAKKIFSLET
jgi:hypothetical protein